jgi:hypothetical protein
MRNNFFALLRKRTDGSIYTDRRNERFEALGMAALLLVVVILFAMLAIMAGIGPSQ